MLNFNFYNPTRIIFGGDTIAKINDYVPTEAKVLMLFGGESARKNGTLAEVREALGAREIHEFGGIEPNPSYETLMKAVELIREQKIDFLMAVGGGSVIDGTKFIAAAVNYTGDTWEILETHGTKITQALPFASVLTLPATGSEMNSGGVVTRKSTQAKLSFSSPYVFPQFSVLDPNKTFSLPTRQLANGVVDAFVHVMEQYLTYPVNAQVQDRFAEGLLQTLIEIGPKILDDSADYDTRANLMWAASMALNGLIGAGVPQDWSTHLIGMSSRLYMVLIMLVPWPLCCRPIYKCVVKRSEKNYYSMQLVSGRLSKVMKNNVLILQLLPVLEPSLSNLDCRLVLAIMDWGRQILRSSLRNLNRTILHS